jgi:hypothetical protein
VLRGQWDRDYGLGPKMSVIVAPMRTHVTLRYEHDLTPRSRTCGQIFVLEIAVAPWRPEPLSV